MTEKVLVSRKTLQELFDGFYTNEECFGYNPTEFKVSGTRRFNKELRALGLLKTPNTPKKKEFRKRFAEIHRTKETVKVLVDNCLGKKFFARGTFDTGLSKLVIFTEMELSGLPNKYGVPRITLYLKDKNGVRSEHSLNELFSEPPENYVYLENWGFYVHENYESQFTKIPVPDEPVVTEMISNVKFGL